MNSLIVGAILVCVATPALAGAVDKMDEVITSGEIREECHLAMPEPTVDEGARFKASLHTIGQDAWHEMWTELDKQDPSHHEANAKKAEFALRYRTEDDMEKAHSLVAEKGCAAIADHARDVLNSYLH